MTKEYYETHKEERKEYAREYYEANKEKIKERDKKYHEAHKEEMNECARKYYEAHREELKEAKRKYREAHREELRKKRLAQYYSRKNEFHGLDICNCITRYYTENSQHVKMSNYFSSLENYVSFLLNPDVKLKMSLICNMRLGKISERDALDAAGVPLTEEDLKYIHENYLKYRPKIN